ncbi:MAG: RecX family transcriptional regulator [Bacteroidales bacterium]|nr:RecX family transcriptional regulator [Bacteroidales bacterium]
MENPEYARCLSRLQKRCSKAEYCSSDVYRKALKALDGDAEAAARVLAALVEEKYVDDVRYAGAFAREKAGLQGWGPIKIRFQLRSKGISEDAIAAALEEVEPGRAADKLERLLAAKARTLEGDPQFRLKMLKFGLSRGYEYAAVEEALKKIGL